MSLERGATWLLAACSACRGSQKQRTQAVQRGHRATRGTHTSLSLFAGDNIFWGVITVVRNDPLVAIFYRATTKVMTKKPPLKLWVLTHSARALFFAPKIKPLFGP